MSGNPYFLINRGTQARRDKEDQGNEISKKIASLISEVHCHTSESAVMNHSSILQIHLNGGGNSLSGGEHSIRIFSPASASSSASSFPLLSKGLIGRGGEKKGGETAAPATGAPPEKAAAIRGRRGRGGTYLGSGVEKFQGICFHFWKKKKKKRLIPPWICHINLSY